MILKRIFPNYRGREEERERKGRRKEKIARTKEAVNLEEREKYSLSTRGFVLGYKSPCNEIIAPVYLQREFEKNETLLPSSLFFVYLSRFRIPFRIPPPITSSYRPRM